MLDPRADGLDVRATIEAVIPETEHAATVVLRPGRGWRPHHPGQWASVGVDVDGVRHHRCYSITSPPVDRGTIAAGRGTLTITVQSVPDGKVSKHLVHDARPGDVVSLDGPHGELTLHDRTDPTAPVLFITGGSGITPVISMLRAVDLGLIDLGAGESRHDDSGRSDHGRSDATDVVLVHHAPDAASALFSDEIDAISRRRPGIRRHLIETGPGAPPPDLALSAARLDGLCPDWRRRETWVCGPRQLVDAATEVWEDPRHRTLATLHVERFTPAATPTADADGGDVRFSASGRLASSDGTTTLLELAEAEGLNPLSGCRMGVCRRCVVPLRSGTVRDLRDGRSTCEAGTHIQICVTTAVGDVDIEL
ncbi:MAG: ferredoxin reductase [Actinobacteria bacterium]|nr:ferredoxin reductase [Actinomycetota bacterium]